VTQPATPKSAGIESGKSKSSESAGITESAETSATASQENALKSAESYLEFESFSESGLVGQLKSEGFSTADAQYGVSHIGVDWNEQAVKSAESYLEFESFSESGLVGQLESEGFTASQAEYGVSKAYK
jgi:SOS response regulatory protein OraA/RecX